MSFDGGAIYRRILVIDGDAAIRDLIGVALNEPAADGRACDARGQPVPGPTVSIEIDAAPDLVQGRQQVRTATAKGLPYAAAFIPHDAGAELSAALWREDSDLAVVQCTRRSAAATASRTPSMPGGRILRLALPC